MAAHFSEEQFAAISGQPLPKKAKYRAVPVIVTLGDEIHEAKAAKAAGITGTRFASKAEARRYLELVMLTRAGQISELELQPRFDLHALDGTKVARYNADFRYYDRSAKRVIVEDVKGGRATRTAVYSMKKKLLAAEHGVEIREVG